MTIFFKLIISYSPFTLSFREEGTVFGISSKYIGCLGHHLIRLLDLVIDGTGCSMNDMARRLLISLTRTMYLNLAKRDLSLI